MPELASPKWEIGLPELAHAAFAGGDGARLPNPLAVIREG
jgi:hypothetical protein